MTDPPRHRAEDGREATDQSDGRRARSEQSAAYDRTIDWDRYWAGADEDDRRGASPSRHHAREVVPEFVRATDARTVADVGCGAGATTFHVARQCPGTTVVGYDAAAPALARNRERAREAGIDGVDFRQAVLPAFDPPETFDLVFSYFTLCYVGDVERALENLYDAVAPGGHLLFNYQTDGAREHWRRMAEDPERLDEAFDPDRFERRFELLLDGESVLSEDRIAEVLGTRPRSAWSVVDRPDVRWAWDDHPLVYVPK